MIPLLTQPIKGKKKLICCESLWLPWLIFSARDWTPVYYTVLYYTCIILYEMFYTDGRSDCMYWTPYGTQNLWNKFNIISDPIQCVPIKTTIAFFEKLPKRTVFAVINPYQSPNKSPHDRISNQDNWHENWHLLAISRGCYGNQLWARATVYVSSWHITCIILA